MTLAPGTRIGLHEVLSPLGAGGMGEVYRARDPRLGREVAIKVLPQELAANPERRSRFEREARSASALHHPNIVTIYEIGVADTVFYISMELVEGRTLRDLLADGPLPAKRLLSIAVQAADALARAHEGGIVHRDLKPENLMLKRDGLVKVLDFGLAKVLPAAASGSELPALSTVDAPSTRTGVVFGTLGYMSPEQAAGKPVDFRSDQFSLGAVLYELATGRAAFARATTAESLVAIIREEPEPLGTLCPQLPVPLRWVIERCLAKDPEERYASTRDLARELAHLRDHLSELSAEAAPLARRRRTRWLAPAAAGLLLAAAVAGMIALRPRQPPPGPQMRFAIPIPSGVAYEPSLISRGISISPEGTRICFEGLSKGRRRLYLRRLDSEEAVELQGSLDASSHFWSPDGRFLAFYADGKLKKIPATGGPPVEICEAPFAMVGTWNREGTILFARIDTPGIYRVQDTGGEAVPVITPDLTKKRTNLLAPQFLPDDRQFLYLVNAGAGLPRELRLSSLDSKVSRLVMLVASRVEYAPPGYLLHVREGGLFAQAFEERNAVIRGEPLLLSPDIHYFWGPAHATFSASRTGALAFQTGARLSRLAWFDREGKELGQLGEPSVIKGLRLSPDGNRAGVSLENAKAGSSDLWVFDVARGVSTRLHSDFADEVMPLWSADGSKLIYRSDRGGPPDIYQLTFGLPGSEKPLFEERGVQQPEDASRDGRLLAFVQEVATTVCNIWLLPLEGDGKPVSWRRTRFNETRPRFSKDGRWIAYESDESGDSEIYLALTDGGGEKRRVSPAGGRNPLWSADGKELYYVAGGGQVMAVPITPGSQGEPGRPAPLFRVENEIENYDVTPNGSRFLLSMPVEKVHESPLRVIVNWPPVSE